MPLALLVPVLGVLIERVPADANMMFPVNAQRLTRFMMDATYGPVRPLSPAWAQRSLLDATSDSDLFGRLAYYEEARDAGSPRGAIFAAYDPDGVLCGFADIGVSLWLPNDRAFRLPQDKDLRRLATSGVGTDGQHKPGVALRGYVSNLVVDTSRRRSGVGRQLMDACEAEAVSWPPDACRIGSGNVAADAADAAADELGCDQLWLEVTSTNKPALAFYEALGYAMVGRTAGSEVRREGGEGGFDIAEVERCVMRKPLS